MQAEGKYVIFIICNNIHFYIRNINSIRLTLHNLLHFVNWGRILKDKDISAVCLHNTIPCTKFTNDLVTL